MLFEFQPDDLKHPLQVLRGTGIPFHTIRIGFQEGFHPHFTGHWGPRFTDHGNISGIFQSHRLEEVFRGGKISVVENDGVITHVSEPSPGFSNFVKGENLGGFWVDSSSPVKKRIGNFHTPRFCRMPSDIRCRWRKINCSFSQFLVGVEGRSARIEIKY